MGQNPPTDMAVVRLLTDAPDEVGVAWFHQPGRDFKRAACTAFGFQAPGGPGERVSGEFVPDGVDGGQNQINRPRVTGGFLTHGYSGCGVWLEDPAGYIGMAGSVGGQDVGFITPVDSLQEIYPGLRILPRRWNVVLRRWPWAAAVVAGGVMAGGLVWNMQQQVVTGLRHEKNELAADKEQLVASHAQAVRNQEAKQATTEVKHKQDVADLRAANQKLADGIKGNEVKELQFDKLYGMRRKKVNSDGVEEDDLVSVTGYCVNGGKPQHEMKIQEGPLLRGAADAELIPVKLRRVGGEQTLLNQKIVLIGRWSHFEVVDAIYIRPCTTPP